MNLLVFLLTSFGLFAGHPSPTSFVAKDKPVKAAQARVCPDNLCLIYGRIQVVDSFPDCKVKIVDSFEDMRVKVVTSFSDDVALWEFVDSFPDYKIQFVDSFPDFTIRYVDNFPGVDGD